MALQLTLSCDLENSESGPTLIHSTGVLNYKIPPEVIRILQENNSNDYFSDHEEGVVCQDSPQYILDILRRNGFTLINETTDDQKALWIVEQGDSSGGDVHPNPTPNDGNEADGGEENQGEAEE